MALRKIKKELMFFWAVDGSSIQTIPDNVTRLFINVTTNFSQFRVYLHTLTLSTCHVCECQLLKRYLV